MGDSKLKICDNTVYEISGNLAYNGSMDVPCWEASENQLAFVGRIVTSTQGFFKGYLVNLYSLDTFHRSFGDAEVPIVGRFVDGRNGSINIVFASTDGGYSRFWMKKKINTGGCGILSYAYTCGDNNEWIRQLRHGGYFRCDVRKAYIDHEEEDAPELASIIESTYTFRTKRCKCAQNAEKAIYDFSNIKERLLDILDEHEGVFANINYPEKK